MVKSMGVTENSPVVPISSWQVNPPAYGKGCEFE